MHGGRNGTGLLPHAWAAGGTAQLRSKAARENANVRAQPILLSATTMVLSVLWKVSATTGSLVMKLRSTLKPTPVPHINTYISSSKLRGESMAK